MLSRIQSRLEELKKQCLDEQPKIYVEPLGKANLDAPSHFAVPLMDTVTEFLDSERKVLLLLGDPGSSKTVFLKRLERRLWEACNGVNDPIPIFIDLPYITNPASDLLGKVLESKNFSQDQRRHLKSSQRQFILLCDGFDEAHVTGNIYYNNDFNGHGQWQAKLVIACRSNKVGRDYRGRFQPEPKNRYDATDLGLFQEAAIAPFTRRQIKDYVTQYVAQERPQLLDRQMSGSGQVAAPRVRSEAQGLPPVVRDWSVDAYMEMLTDIPNLMDVVKNPYVLSFVLRLLPTIAGSASDFSRACVSFDTLYKHFFDDWMEVNKRRLHTMHMSDSEHQAHGELIDSDFTASSMDYLKDLAVEILRRQGGDPVIQYSDFKERDTWKARFLGSESRTKVLRESVPIVRSGSSYRLVHDSMIDYLYSLVVFDADHKSDPSNIGGGGPLTLSTQEMSEDTKRKGTLELISISERPMTVQFLADRAQNSEPFRSWLIEM
ncbi:Transducin (beta)-like 1 X-linked receptor 1, partial [Mortierella sp. GBA35]